MECSIRTEKRSVQASAHPLSQAQGGIFCVLTVFVCVVLREFWLRLNEIHMVRTFSLFRDLKITLGSEQPILKEKRIIPSVWGRIKSFEHLKEASIFLIVHSICELILSTVLLLLSPGWIKTRLYSVINSLRLFFLHAQIYYLCRTSFILAFSQRTIKSNACEWTNLCAWNFIANKTPPGLHEKKRLLRSFFCCSSNNSRNCFFIFNNIVLFSGAL